MRTESEVKISMLKMELIPSSHIVANELKSGIDYHLVRIALSVKSVGYVSDNKSCFD